MQDSLIRQIHERGHLGPEKTEKLLKMDDWFKGAKNRKRDKYVDTSIFTVTRFALWKSLNAMREVQESA